MKTKVGGVKEKYQENNYGSNILAGQNLPGCPEVVDVGKMLT